MNTALKIVGIILMAIGAASTFFTLHPETIFTCLLILIGFILFTVGLAAPRNKKIVVRRQQISQLKVSQLDERGLDRRQAAPLDTDIDLHTDEKSVEEIAELNKTSVAPKSLLKKNKTALIVALILAIIFLLSILFVPILYDYVSDLTPIDNEKNDVIIVEILSTYEYNSVGYIDIDGVEYCETRSDADMTRTYEIDKNDLSVKKEEYSITLSLTSAGLEAETTVYNVTEYVKFQVGGTPTYLDDVYKEDYYIECVESR